jgi:hypothetical protein
MHPVIDARRIWGAPQRCHARVGAMERVVRMFGSFEDADAADDQFYGNLTPTERLDILLELIERHRRDRGEAASRLARVYRVVELSQR